MKEKLFKCSNQTFFEKRSDAHILMFEWVCRWEFVGGVVLKESGRAWGFKLELMGNKTD